MHRFTVPGLVMLLLGLVARAATAQRAGDGPASVLQEPRPDPILPAAAAPFAIGPDLCRRGHVPTVSVRVYAVIGGEVATMSLRDHRSIVLDNVPLKCGQYVAHWDGTINGGTRVAPPGIYYVQFLADSVAWGTKRLIVTAP
jgi:hypothetical protein